MASSGSLEKMKIASFTDDKFSKKSKDEEAHEFSVLINPASYSHSLEILYNDKHTPGSGHSSPDYNRVSADFVKFELVFDGTGVIPDAVQEISGDGITKQLDKFRKVLFDYESEVHSPKYLILNWGTLYFRCRLSSLDFNYTLFKPDGTPLRARANVTFIAFSTEKELNNNAAKTSSDRSHLVR
jgi:hypothetical protein